MLQLNIIRKRENRLKLFFNNGKRPGILRMSVFYGLLIGCLFFSSVLAAQEDLSLIEEELIEILNRDQGVRKKLTESALSREERQDLLAEMRADDQVHQTYISALLDRAGWPEDLSNYKAHLAIFLVIDHAPLEFQQKYVHMVREMEQKEILHPSLCVNLYDRIQMRTGQPQVYGTQTFSIPSTGRIYVWPVLYPEGLAERRRPAELNTIEEYLENFPGIIWDKEMTPAQADSLIKQR